MSGRRARRRAGRGASAVRAAPGLLRSRGERRTSPVQALPAARPLERAAQGPGRGARRSRCRWVRRLGGPTVPGRRPWGERSKCGLQVSWLEPVTSAATALPPVGHLSENSPVPGRNIAGYRALWAWDSTGSSQDVTKGSLHCALTQCTVTPVRSLVSMPRLRDSVWSARNRGTYGAQRAAHPSCPSPGR